MFFEFFGFLKILSFIFVFAFAIAIFGLLYLSFNTSFVIENSSGEDVWVTPYAIVDGGNRHVPFHKEYFMKKDESVRVDFNWDDLSLRYFEVRNNTGRQCRLIASEYYGRKSCCHPPEQEVYFIQPLSDPECDPSSKIYAEKYAKQHEYFEKNFNKIH